MRGWGVQARPRPRAATQVVCSEPENEDDNVKVIFSFQLCLNLLDLTANQSREPKNHKDPEVNTTDQDKHNVTKQVRILRH